ncbi:MAG: hypothetical protein MMC33_000828 [Icmadophila ericetorum]|nr:hypothetical protein [Icmadophila ericetorum]
MSGLEFLAIAGCIAAVVSAYHDGSELLLEIKERRKQKRERREAEALAIIDETATKELEMSLTRGEVTIRGQYDRGCGRVGEPFKQGDQIAREELKDVIIYLQSQVITNLKLAWKQEAFVDFHVLEKASDDSQDRAIMCLLQLQQRLLVAAPIDRPLYSPPPPAAPAKTPISPPKRNYTPGFVVPVKTEPELRSTSWAVTPLAVATPKKSPPILSSPISTPEAEKKKPLGGMLGGLRRSKGSTRPRSTSKMVEETRPFEERPKSKVHNIQSDSSSIVSEYNNSPGSGYRFKRLDSTSTGTSGSSIMEPEHELSLNPWDEQFVASPASPSSKNSYGGFQLEPDGDFTDHLGDSKKKQSNTNTNTTWNQPDPQLNMTWNQPVRRSPSIPDVAPLNIRPKAKPLHSPQVSHTFSYSGHRSSQGSDPQSSRPSTSTTNHSSSEPSTSTLTPQISAPIIGAPYLPNEENGYTGLCKGAWLQQIGMPKKAMQERARPASVYVTMQTYWKCKTCNFEGRMFKDAKKKAVIDTRVFSADGIRYRWEFLFKSHVPMKETIPNPITSSNFGCIFCCAEGKGMPIFGGVNAFMGHLQEHRARPPQGEVLYRMKLITGRLAEGTEVFDINLPPP